MDGFKRGSLVCGVDLGSVATKLVIMRGEEILFKAVAPTGARAAAVAQGLLEEGLRQTSALWLLQFFLLDVFMILITNFHLFLLLLSVWLP